MRIFLTMFWDDGLCYAGPNLLADTREEAELMAEGSGVEIVAEVEDLVVTDEGVATLHCSCACCCVVVCVWTRN